MTVWKTTNYPCICMLLKYFKKHGMLPNVCGHAYTLIISRHISRMQIAVNAKNK
jgi:hypothetical protein